MKRKTAKEILAESLKELALKKNVFKITVKDIADNCGYSTATFYRQFRDKYDLIAWDYVNYLEHNILQVGKDGFTWKDALLYSAKYHYENKEYLANLIRNTDGRYSFEQYMAEANYDFIIQTVNRNGAEPTEQEKKCLLVYCYGNIKYNSDWILGRIEATPEESAEIYSLTIPEPLRKYFI